MSAGVSRPHNGYDPGMTTAHPEERPVDLEGVPAEEGISSADAADRIDEDPDEQVNYTERKAAEREDVAD
ncbi:MAG: hypothetical protein JWO76_2531 [Nocardioides sp.]|nr:hypothetical protein [Nocardioides sp.]